MGLYISVSTASSELSASPLYSAIIALATAVARNNQMGRVPQGPSLDVTFLLPGKTEKPDFTGMRMGGYTTDGDTLYFETAVPEHILHSPRASQYVALAMQDVVDNAHAFFQEAGMGFETDQWQGLLAAVSDTAIPMPIAVGH